MTLIYWLVKLALLQYTVVQNNQESRCNYWATRSSICSHRSPICLLRTACSAHTLHCAHSFTRALTHCQAHGKVNYQYWYFWLFWTILQWAKLKSHSTSKILTSYVDVSVFNPFFQDLLDIEALAVVVDNAFDHNGASLEHGLRQRLEENVDQRKTIQLL